MNNNNIPKGVISRLPRYYRYLGELLSSGLERVSSNDLSQLMKLSMSQIRQDLHHFGGFGQAGYGYNIIYLYSEIGKILKLDKTHNLVVIGAGNLGQTLTNYATFEQYGFKIIGIFDNNPALDGQDIGNTGLKVQLLDELPDFLNQNDIDIAVLTIPKQGALAIIDILVTHEIKGIWNFAHVDLNLRVPDTIAVENVHLSESLMRLSFRLDD